MLPLAMRAISDGSMTGSAPWGQSGILTALLIECGAIAALPLLGVNTAATNGPVAAVLFKASRLFTRPAASAANPLAHRLRRSPLDRPRPLPA
jgi:hypothetical protein